LSLGCSASGCGSMWSLWSSWTPSSSPSKPLPHPSRLLGTPGPAPPGYEVQTDCEVDGGTGPTNRYHNVGKTSSSNQTWTVMCWRNARDPEDRAGAWHVCRAFWHGRYCDSGLGCKMCKMR
jgi:hypothetical protein